MTAPNDDDSDDVPAQEHCAICLANFCSGDVVAVSHHKRCSHIYHHDCIFEWLLKSNDCPCCRRKFLFPPIARQSSGENTEDLDVEVATNGSPSNAAANASAPPSYFDDIIRSTP